MKRLFTLASLVVACGANAQSLSPTVVASAGSYGTGGGFSLSYTVGEPVVTTVSGGNRILTQGFQQPDDKVVNITELDFDNVLVKLYPNPASETVNLWIKCDADGCRNLKVSIHDLLGRELFVPGQSAVNGNETLYAFNLKQLAASMYFVRLQSPDGSLSKIIKFNKTSL